MSTVATTFDAAGLTMAAPPGLPLPPHILAALELGPPPGLSPLPLSLTAPFSLGFCQSSLEGDDEKLTRKTERSGSSDLDSQCSTIDTAEALEDDAPLVPQTLSDAGYNPGRVLRKEASLRLSTAPRLLSLVDTIEEPPREGGMPGCPSVGSAGHHLGLCTPCDFVHRGSCRTGFACKFCHLCGPEANKQKKKDRRKLVRAMARMQTEDEAAEDDFCGLCNEN
jgi:hypothetical protein